MKKYTNDIYKNNTYTIEIPVVLVTRRMLKSIAMSFGTL